MKSEITESRKTSPVRPLSTPSDDPARTAQGTVYLTLVKALSRDQLLAQYQKFHGMVQGEIELSNQYSHIFEEGRTRSGVATESAARILGAAHFTTKTSHEADALAAEMIRIVAEQNATIPSELLHKKIAISIVLAPAGESLSTQSLESTQAAYEEAEELTHDAHAGQIRIAGDVYQSLPADRQKLYTQIESPGRLQTAVWQRAASTLAPSAADRCVMVIDMARFSRIEANMALLDPDKGSCTLRNQINSIIAEGFKRAGAASYERYMYKFDGDGGIFIFPDPATAHKVAVEVLKQADEKNKRSRDQRFEDGMRCFRIGIDFGRLDRDARDDFSGEILARTKRLESGGPSGEIRASADFYRRLPIDLRKAYGDEEPIFGKDHDQPVPGRRLAVGARALWPETGRDNLPFPPPRQPNNEFVVPAEPAKTEFCFVVCPLSADQPRVNEIFDKLIAPACEKAGFLPRRANELPGDRKVVIAGHLSSAPLVIAYLGSPTTGWNDNVILEVGFRLATGLPLVMISDADKDGKEPEYQHLLPFQIAHHNVITVAADPARKIDALQREISENRNTKASSDWESPNPIIEFKFTDLKDVLITDANEAARTLFGADNVRKNQNIEKLRTAFANRTDPIQADARRIEQLEILTKLWQRKTFGDTMTNWQPPRAKIPVVFNDAPIDPETGNPIGYLPVILRYSCDESVTRVRYVYLRVSACLKRHPAGYFISDL